ncbi:TonB-dependent receptor [Pedobacter nyackensis]|uniref:SusC/RagA family TonB-linked outer membrane protein n=1 Tax=Pedobacter nyackensis TaxID=475255 RepID=UPI00293193D7|nr:TonB-dependent receptor [Pedobacter nyackensis]
MRKIYIFLMCMLYSALTFGQQTRQVAGVVTEQGPNTPLAGVSVLVKGTKTGATTDKDGRYKIQVPSTGNSTLVFTYIGYLKREVNVGDKGVLNVVLTEDSKSLNDVVVIGYGTSKKGDLVSSVAQVDMKDMVKAPVRSIDEALAGRVAGVQVNSSDGQPGSAVNIVIRGANSITQSNSPLYVVDGFPMEGFNLNTFDPKDVESIDVLKDASATAIYGARGANGVIMITTKKGKIGEPAITFDPTVSVDNNIKTMKLMSPYEFAKLQLELFPDAKGSASDPTPIYRLLTRPNMTLEDYRNVPATDWQSPFFQTGVRQDYSLALRGGTGKTVYSVSGNINDQKGTIINTKYKRYQGRVTLDQTVNDKLKVGINANYSYLLRGGNSASQGTGGSGTTLILYSVWGYSPLSDYTIEDAIDETTASGTDYKFNPIMNQLNMLRNNKTFNLNVNGYLDYAITKELKLRVTGGINNSSVITETFNNSKTYLGSPLTTPGRSSGVNGSIREANNNNWSNENTLTWTKTYAKDHNVNVLGGFSAQGNKSNEFGFGATLLPNEKLGLSGLSEGLVQPNPTSGSSLWNLASFFGRVKYNYKSIYYLEASYRADGSSKFAPNNKWSYFPSVGASWRFFKESFFKDSKILSDGKLRISYGKTGNNRVSDFAYLSTNRINSGTSYPWNNEYVTSIYPSSLGNSKVKWETTDQYDAGLDVAFLKNRISFTADVYKKNTKDLLLRATLPTSSGYTTAFKNIGAVSNKGIEFSLNTVNISKKDFQWTSSFNISFNRNKVLALTEDQLTLPSTTSWDNGYANIPSYIAKIGEPLGLMYGFIWEGNYQYSDFTKTSTGEYLLRDDVTANGNARSVIQPGDIKYKDINGDGNITSADYAVIGKSLPVHTGGFSNNFTYKNFDLNVFFQWSYGNDIQNTNRLVFEGSRAGSFLQQFDSYSDRWTPDNQGSLNHRAGGFSSAGYSSRTIEDGSFLRLKTVSLGYNMPKDLLKNIKINAVRLFVSAQNLYTWTNYSGLDPEVSTYNSVLTGGFDYSAYPRARTLAFGANITF